MLHNSEYWKIQIVHIDILTAFLLHVRKMIRCETANPGKA